MTFIRSLTRAIVSVNKERELNTNLERNRGVKVKAAVRGRIRHGSLMAYCTLDPFLHSSLEALHTERYAVPQLAKEGTMWRKFCYQTSNLHRLVGSFTWLGMLRIFNTR
jgi:hypothetical protein